jgi:hypothetical protein
MNEGEAHLKQSIELYDPARHAFFASLYVLDPMISSLCMLGRFEVVLEIRRVLVVRVNPRRCGPILSSGHPDTDGVTAGIVCLSFPLAPTTQKGNGHRTRRI